MHAPSGPIDRRCGANILSWMNPIISGKVLHHHFFHQGRLTRKDTSYAEKNDNFVQEYVQF